ncbi:unnamed protein product [Durusdinium trenchii]|uniref:Ion transport domain-containing protein n=1 Tax=Durusdinium trenchii TaxID=1381693 RepID=A0ABP0SF02_9DINO
MTERWRQLLDQLGQELEQQAAQLKDLEDKNRQLLDAEAARKGRLSHASRDSEDSIEVEGGDVVPNVIPRNYHERGSRVSVMDSMEVDPLVPNPPPSLLRPQRPSQASVASLADATKLLAAEKMQLSVLRAEKTIEFAAQRPWWVINPDSNRFSHVWQVVTNFALAFVALVTPLQVGLLEIDWDALFVITWCVDIVFMIDMVLQFITMYPRTTARGMELEYRPSKIAKHYMMTWFCLDFATLIPLDTIGLLAGADRLKDLRSIKIIRVLRLLKLMRLLRSSKLTHRIEIPVSIPYQHVALLRFLLVLILACHWLACVWAMTLKLVDEKYPQWINEIELADAPYGIVTRESPLRIYIASYYFCCYTMTSVGYGDFGPRNVLERMACLCHRLGDDRGESTLPEEDASLELPHGRARASSFAPLSFAELLLAESTSSATLDAAEAVGSFEPSTSRGSMYRLEPSMDPKGDLLPSIHGLGRSFRDGGDPHGALPRLHRRSEPRAEGRRVCPAGDLRQCPGALHPLQGLGRAQ